MALQAFFNSDGTELTAVITVVGSDGNHVDPDSWPIANDPAIVLSSHSSAAKTVTKVDTGVYTAEWTGLSPALNNGDVVNIAIDGAISSTAWSTWRSFLQVVRLPSSQASVDAIDTVVDAIKVITDQFNFTVAGQVDANALSGVGGDDAATIYSHFTNSTNADAFKADVSSLASQASVDGLNDIAAADVYTHFTTSTNADAFKADVSALASQASVDGLNDIAAADVYTHFTTATNADAFKADVSSLASQASVDTVDSVVDAVKVVTDQFNFTVAGQVDANALTGGGGDDAATIYSHFTNSTNADAFKADVSSLASQASVDGLNDLSAADVTAAVPTAAGIADAVLDESLASHTVAGSVGKALKQLKEGTISVDGSVNDLSATTTSFVSNLTNATSSFYHDKVIVFVSGSLAGQARHVETYDGSTKAITVSEGFTFAPANGDEFLILATHEHSISEIQSGLASQASVDGLNDLSAADVTAAVPTAVEIRTEIDSGSTVLAAILADTDELQSDDVPGLIAALNNISVADLLTTPMVESYAADGVAPTLTQAILLTLQHMSESSVLGTTKTVKRLDGSTDAATFTLDDANDPSSITRTS